MANITRNKKINKKVKKKMELVLTDNEKKKEEKHQEICADFVQCSAEHPGIKVTKIIRTVASKHDMTIPGIRRILIAKGIYQRKR